MSAQFLIVLSGPPAVGKNTIADEVGVQFPNSLAVIDLDQVKRFIASDPRTDFFLDLAREVGCLITQKYLEASLSVLIHNSFCRYDFVRPFLAIAVELRVPAWYFKLTAPLDELLRRNQSRVRYCNPDDVRRIYEIDRRCTHEIGISIDTTVHDANAAAAIIRRAVLCGDATTEYPL